MRALVFSHGFGVSENSRGLFTDIANSFPNIQSVMFNYNTFDLNGDATVPSVDKQAKLLQNMITQQDGEIILIGHSQGSLIVGLVDLSGVDKVILLAPPVKMSMQHVIDKMLKRPGSSVDLDGMSRLKRTDGTITYISKEYMKSVDNKNPMKIYQDVANTKPTLIVRATNDNVLGLTCVDEVTKAKHVDIYADHEFSGEARKELIKQIRDFI